MSSSRARRAVIAVIVLAALPFLVAAGGGDGGQSDQARAEHQRIVNFWTAERVAQAVPRDFYRNPASGQFVPARKPVPPDPGTSYVSGSSWTKGGQIVEASGKVLFMMADQYWICSATAIADTAGGRSLILTAAHCVYDEANHEFAANWMFIPAYDLAPEPLTVDGAFCQYTEYGCWTPTAMVVRQEYDLAGGFNDQAVLHDFAVVAVQGGEFNGDRLLENVVREQTAVFAPVSAPANVYAFGYPAEKKWNGSDLIYCKEPLSFDSSLDNATYRLSSCALNGGSSGGPWLYAFTEDSGAGTVMSVNSYGYPGVKAMFGPKLNDDAQSVYNTALSATGQVLVP